MITIVGAELGARPRRRALHDLPDHTRGGRLLDRPAESTSLSVAGDRRRLIPTYRRHARDGQGAGATTLSPTGGVLPAFCDPVLAADPSPAMQETLPTRLLPTEGEQVRLPPPVAQLYFQPAADCAAIRRR